MLSGNFQTRASNFMLIAFLNRLAQVLAGMRDCPLDGGCGDGRRRSHEDLGTRITHAAFKVARARGNADFFRTEHAHVATAAGAARWIGDDSARFDERRDDTRPYRIEVNPLGTWRDDETRLSRHLATRQHARGE